MPLNYDNYDALSFDCYGTLIDWESGIWRAFQPLLVENPHLQIDQNQLLTDFAAFENEIQSNHPGMPYPEVLKSIHNRFALFIRPRRSGATSRIPEILSFCLLNY